MNGFLLDSDVLICVLRSRQETLRLLESLDAPMGISVISRAEIWAGAKEEEAKRIQELFEALMSYPVENHIADLAGTFLKKFKPTHRTLDLEDTLIAATAVHHHLILVTYNSNHFPMPELKLHPVQVLS